MRSNHGGRRLIERLEPRTFMSASQVDSVGPDLDADASDSDSSGSGPIVMQILHDRQSRPAKRTAGSPPVRADGPAMSAAFAALAERLRANQGIAQHNHSWRL